MSRPFRFLRFHIPTQEVARKKWHAVANNSYEEDYQQVERLKESSNMSVSNAIVDRDGWVYLRSRGDWAHES